MNSRNPVYSFGDCRLDLERGALTRGSGDVSLRPKPFLVLQYFLEHPGRLIPKSELMHAVWPDAFVTDDSLVQCLSEIRRAIGDEQQTAIKTVPRRGYLFSLPVTIERDQTVSPPTERPAPSLRLKRWHLITASLVVIAGTISAWLWLRSQTAPTAVGTTSLEARDLYQRGRYLLDRQTPADSLLAVDYMQRATVVDPSFALASVGLSEAYNRLHMHGTCRPSECMPKAREAARRAIELAPNLGEAYAMRALVQTGYDFDHASAEQSFDRARALAPDSRLVLGYYASFLATQGRFNESI